MKYVLFIIAFFSFYCDGFSQTAKADSRPVYGQWYKPMISEICYIGTPKKIPKYYGFKKGDSIQWDIGEGFRTGIITYLCDSEKCLAKAYNDTAIALLYFDKISYCAFCNFRKGDHVRWMQDGTFRIGTIVNIPENKSTCFVKVDDGNVVVDISAIHSYVLHLP